MKNNLNGYSEKINKKIYLKDWKPFSWIEKDELWIQYFFEKWVLIEKNYYTEDWEYVFVEHGFFDKNNSLYNGQIDHIFIEENRKIYSSYVKSGINIGIEYFSDNAENKEIEDEKNNVKEKISESIKINYEEQIWEEDFKIISDLDENQKAKVLNEIHIIITDLIKSKIYRWKYFSKEETEENSISKNLSNLSRKIHSWWEFLEIFFKTKKFFEKLWQDIDFLKEYKNNFENISEKETSEKETLEEEKYFDENFEYENENPFLVELLEDFKLFEDRINNLFEVEEKFLKKYEESSKLKKIILWLIYEKDFFNNVISDFYYIYDLYIEVLEWNTDENIIKEIIERLYNYNYIIRDNFKSELKEKELELPTNALRKYYKNYFI